MALNGFKIAHNLAAMFGHRQGIMNNGNLNKALERLSSGYKINRASDDAAGLAVSERLRTQIRGYVQAAQNIQDATSLIQVTDGALSGLHDMLQRMRELAVQAANDTYSSSDRSLIQLEVDQLLNEINRMQTSVEFNRLKLLDGTFSSTVPTFNAQGIPTLRTNSVYRGSLLFQVGPNGSQRIRINIATLSVYGISSGLNSLFSSSGAVVGNFLLPAVPGTALTPGQVPANGILTQRRAESAIGILDSAINTVSRLRAKFGALENRITNTFDFATIASEELQRAESRIRDADMAAEITEFTRAQVLVQSANAMLAQANLVPQNVLSLLG